MIPKGIQETFRIALYRARAYYRLGRAKEIEQPPLTDWEQLLANTTQALDWLNKPYSHRNGETEPPTVGGYYWLRCGPVLETVPVWIDDSGVALAWYGVDPGMVDGEWYGPIPKPEV